ncbi:response regulator [Candidatus Raskinella chloraquaticus]|uniref:response regulator n=1 Tax=Candidatus Raskinella chloraquaticus TaxID=1951219 RepID=UPI00366BF041
MAIHIVEDDHAVADAMAYLLRLQGFEAFTHASAEAFFAAGPPCPEDALIVDLALPGIDGAGVVRWVQAMSSPPDIIVVSAQSQSVISRQLRDLRVKKMLRKPLTREAVLEAIVR